MAVRANGRANSAESVPVSLRLGRTGTGKRVAIVPLPSGCVSREQRPGTTVGSCAPLGDTFVRCWLLERLGYAVAPVPADSWSLDGLMNVLGAFENGYAGVDEIGATAD